MASPQTSLEQALAFQRQNKRESAVEAYHAALAEDPSDPVAHTGLALLLQQLGRLTEAETHIRRALAGAPDKSIPLGILASTLIDQGRVEEACDAANEACRLDPATWQLQSNRLLYSLYDFRLTAEERHALHREWGRTLPAETVPLRKTARPAGSRLRIAYLSADFRNHPIAFFLEPLLRWHDRSRFEITCYSDVAQEDAFTERLRGLSEKWVVTRGMPEDQLARLLVEHGIDVLVELAGHSAENRLGVARRVQAEGIPVVHYIGYPGTTGMSGTYRFSDALLDPPGDEALYTETTLRLPAFWSYAAPTEAPAPNAPPALRGKPFTFGSFNYLGKVNAQVIDVWARILREVPHSRLVLKAKSFDDVVVRDRVRAAFETHGVEGGRLEVQGSTPFAKYMADFGEVDLCLDPFPFNGGTTTFHSFYMGVPIVALEGRGHAERMGAALLRHVGLPEFVARDVDEYVAIAARAAGHPCGLAELRAGLRQRMEHSALMDGAGQARAIEKRFREILGLPEPAVPPSPARRELRVERMPFAQGRETVAISVIACGRDPKKRQRLTEQVRERLGGRGAELLYVENPPSLAAGYNAALKEAQGKIVLFMHDDVDLLSPDFAQRLQKHLETYDVVGVAGTSRLIDGAWGRAGQPYLFGQVAHPRMPGEGGGYVLCAFSGVGTVFGKIQALDGLLMAARREVAAEIGFDEATFDGFHLYDLDFSFRAFLAGRRIAVANDLFVIHHSWGEFGEVWRRYHDRFVAKFAGQFAPPPAQANHWFAKSLCRNEAELMAKMRRNASLGGGFSY